MKKIVVLALLVVAGYLAWKKIAGEGPKLKPLYSGSYIVVYGQDSCRWTQSYIRKLKGAGVACIYKNLDQQEVSQELYSRMQEARLETSTFILPVVDVNGRILVRPRMDIIFSIYNKDAGGAEAAGQAESHASATANQYSMPYVVVYGRDSCAWTQKSLEELRNAGIKYTYKIIDQFEVEEELYWRMKDAGLDTSSYELPVVDVNRKIFTRPKIEKIVPLYRAGAAE